MCHNHSPNKTRIGKLSLEHGTDIKVINKYDETTLTIAQSEGATEIVKLLSEKLS